MVLIVFLIALQPVFGRPGSGVPGDTASFLERVFSVFALKPGALKEQMGKSLRNDYQPYWNEFFLKDSFPLFGTPRFRIRKKGCNTIRELVFSLGKVNDVVSGKENGDKRSLQADDRAGTLVDIVNFADNHPDRYVTDFDMGDAYDKNFYGETGYKNELYHYLDGFLLRLREGDSRLTLSICLHDTGKDVFEVEFVFTEGKCERM